MKIFNAIKPSLWATAISSLICVLVPLNLSAQTVVLKSKTGNIRIDGKLVEFDGEFYSVETDLGILTVDGRTVNCTGDGCPSASDLISRFGISGAGELGKTVVPALLEAFALSLEGEITALNFSANGQTMSVRDLANQEVAEITISVKPENVSFADLAKGGNLIAATSRLPTDPELAALKTTDLGDLMDGKQQQIMAIDGIVAAVSPVNPLDTVALEDLHKILTGEISNWREIGGPDVEIDLYFPGSIPAFSATLAASRLALEPDQISTKAIRLDTLAQVADAAAGNPFGIGLTNFSNLRNATALGLKGNCGIYSLPSVFTLKSGGYPLTYQHYFFHSKPKLPLFAREFLDFAKSDQAQNVIRGLGYGDLGISALSLDHQGLRLANTIGQSENEMPIATILEMVRLQNGAKRLSTTFRFIAGSKTLDAQSLQYADLLASGLILGNYADKQVHIIGYTDAAGSSSQNILLAEKQAKAVHTALIAAAPEGSLDDVGFLVSGYGESSPLACEDTQADKQTNRRVEIWIKDR
ncbi:MAG: OmpA family protein [Rhodobacteraceae bacterium]|nr:OmpA family protein [Paracoccaceae bacterium]